MARSVVVTERRPIQIPKYGITVAAIGALMITLDGIVGLVRNSLLVPTIGTFGLSTFLVAGTEAVLGILAVVSLYMSLDTPSAVSYIVGVIAVVSLAVGGGFYFVGAAVALVGAFLMHYHR